MIHSYLLYHASRYLGASGPKSREHGSSATQLLDSES